MNLSVLFPGQGAYYGGALQDLQQAHSEIGATYDEVDGAVRPLLGEGIGDELLRGRRRTVDDMLEHSTELLQLAIYTTSVATFRVLQRAGLRPDVLLGHSLGEIAALVCSGAFTAADGARIVCHRSLALRDANLGDAYMVALGAGASRAEQILDLVGDPDTTIAVENSQTQTVLSGRAETLDTIARIAAALRISFSKLKSPYPFHSPLLDKAAADFAARISDIRPRAIDLPVYSPILGRFYRADDDLIAALPTHLVRRVRFQDAVGELHREGTRVFVEAGALDALTSIVRRVVEPSAEIVAISPLLPEPAEIAVFAEALERLEALGLVDTLAATAAEALHQYLLPEVSPDDFQRFWSQSGPHVRALVREHFSRVVGPEPRHDASDGIPNAQTSVTVTVRDPVDRDRILAGLVRTYATALEYPVEVFTEDTDLEAELGIDSVKQTELMARVTDDYGLPPQPPGFRLADYNTLGKVADLICSISTAGPTDASPHPVPERQPHALPASKPEPGRNRERTLASLVETYASALEYPVEVFAEDTDLEAELGIDSVKQTELMARVTDDYGLPPEPPGFRLADYNTLGKIADLICASSAPADGRMAPAR